MRTIELQFTQEDRVRLFERTDMVAAQRAIGYLTTWAMDDPNYADCTLWISHDFTELNANYRNGLANTYAIGAVWNGHAFGFHS